MLVSLASLWLPIVLGAVFVFIASSILHMVLPFHHHDYKKLPDEEKVGAAIRASGAGRGLYIFPFGTHKEMNTPAMQEKFKQGPVGTMTLLNTGPINMPRYLGQWFGYCLIMNFFIAYVAAVVLPPGTDYLRVFRVVGTIGFIGYGLSQLANGIWKAQPWKIVLKEVIDGLIYGLLVAGTFGWRWPR